MSIPVIVATVGAIDANSYGTRAEADVYHATQLHPDAPWPSNVSATTTIGSGANGVVTVTVDAAGTEGNSYTAVATVNAGASAALAVTLVGTVVTIVLGTAGAGVADATKNTALLVAASIDALTGISASASGTGETAISAFASQTFTGGSYIEETKNPALIMAAQQMDTLIEWVGYTTSSTQRLLWPRQGIMSRNLWFSIPSDSIPSEIKSCQFELARLLLNADRTVESDITAQGITSLKAGPIALTFKTNAPSAPVIPSVATDLLVPSWIEEVRGQQSMTRELVRF